jgi:hypothetical protein
MTERGLHNEAPAGLFAVLFDAIEVGLNVWQLEPERRVAPAPATVGRRRSLSILRPALCRELHPTGNPHADRLPACALARRSEALSRAAVSSPERSFGARHPHLVPEWHSTRNRDRDPYTVAPSSELEVWWRCAQCGREWQLHRGQEG